MTAYQQAIRLATIHGRDFYVNRHPAGPSIREDGEVLLVMPYKERLCCAVAHSDGTLEYVVQGYSRDVELMRRVGDQVAIARATRSRLPCVQGLRVQLTNKDTK